MENAMFEAETALGKVIASFLFDVGKAEGKAEGLAEGGAKLLLRMLAKRFGAVAEDVTSRILSATGDQLERAAEALLDASRPEEVLSALGAT